MVTEPLPDEIETVLADKEDKHLIGHSGFVSMTSRWATNYNEAEQF